MPPNDFEAIAAVAGRHRFPAGPSGDIAGQEARTDGAARWDSFEAVLEAIRSRPPAGPDAPTVDHRGAVSGGLLAGGMLAALGRAMASPDEAPTRPAPRAGGRDQADGEIAGQIWPGPNPGVAGPRRALRQTVSSPRSGRDSAWNVAGSDAVDPQVAVLGVEDDEPTPPA